MENKNIVVEEGELSEIALQEDVLDAYYPDLDMSKEDYHPNMNEEELLNQSLAFKKLREQKSAA